MQRTIPRLLFAAPASGSGKTMITCAFLAMCRKRQLDCRAMKCGPDYIDPMFHHYVLGVPGGNLDSFFLEEEALKTLFIKAADGCEMAVMEGVMGYYDGVAGTSTQASTYDIARITKTPVILVVDAKKGSLSLAAVIKGFLDFREEAGICGVILNRTSAAVADRLRPHIEALGICLVGYIPECEEARLESRHLGLTLPEEQQALREKIEILADRLTDGLDIDWLMRTAAAAPAISVQAENDIGKMQLHGQKGTNYRLAVASDEAFSFYYQENLRCLRQMGAELIFYSPLHDQELPPGIDAVLLGGGYPEVFAGELAANQSMRESLQAAVRSGVRILAECGGFLYLQQTLEGTDGSQYPMTGILPGHGFRTGRLSRFGYLTLKGPFGEIKGHEFHYWDSDNCGDTCLAVKPLSERSWTCMHQTENIFAGFPHLYYPSNPKLIYRFLTDKEQAK